MFHDRTLNNRINRLHERALRLVYKNNNCTFQELLEKDNAVTIHHRNLQRLAIEMYKVNHEISPDFVREIFPRADISYNLRNTNYFKRSNVKSVFWGSETLRNLGPQIWGLIPKDIKNLPTLASFKTKIKQWKTNECPCRLCKTYFPDLGFI